MLKEENLDHVTTHRWPPLAYEQEMEEYYFQHTDKKNNEKMEAAVKMEADQLNKKEEKSQRKKLLGLRCLV